MDHIGSEPQEGEEQMDPPSGQPTGESQLSLRSPKPEAMDADALAGLLFRMGEVPIPEDRVDLVSSTGQGAGLFRDPRFHARGAFRSNEDDADRHVIPRTPRRVARSVSRSSRRRRGSATPVLPRAGAGRRRGPG